MTFPLPAAEPEVRVMLCDDSATARAILARLLESEPGIRVVHRAADGRALVRAVRVAGKVEPVFVEQVAQMRDAVLSVVRAGDVVVTMGAGSVAGLAPELARAAQAAGAPEAGR